jgi:hypothetical protein
LRTLWRTSSLTRWCGRVRGICGDRIPWDFRPGLADAGGHGEAEVGIDIDLGAAGAAGDFDIGFGDAGGVFSEFTAVPIDFGDQIFGDAGGAVEDEGIIAEAGIHEGLFDGA